MGKIIITFIITYGQLIAQSRGVIPLHYFFKTMMIVR